MDSAAWEHLFSTKAYVRLKEREAGLKRDFSDDGFRAFVESGDLAARAPALKAGLREWKKADIDAALDRTSAYLPAGTTIRATVYVVIKPQKNSFVHDLKTNPAIFLYLDPTLSRRKVEETLAHELHHIGYASINRRIQANLSRLAPQARKTAEWARSLGEGFAVLAAAGGPDAHPHASSEPSERERWEAGLANFNSDLKRLEKFFLDVMDQRLHSDEEARQAATEFFGVQGPWYTVGWRMATVVEKRFGRAELLECMQDPGRLLGTYNRAAGQGVALWSERLVEALR